MNYLKHIGAVLLLMLCTQAHGQKFAVSTNAIGYVNLCTLNAEFSYALGRHWTINASAKYNPFTFNAKGTQIRNRQQCYSAGARFWPWHTFSGWWVAGKAQYQEYNSGGIFSSETSEGDRWGAGVSAGYTYMVHPHLNLEFGLGFWAGYGKYTVYSCPVCGLTKSSGQKAFILPNDVIVGICYVF